MEISSTLFCSRHHTLTLSGPSSDLSRLSSFKLGKTAENITSAQVPAAQYLWLCTEQYVSLKGLRVCVFVCVCVCGYAEVKRGATQLRDR